MVGRIEYRREKGRGGLRLEYIGPLSVLTGTLFEPEGLSGRRLGRRLARLEKALARQGAGRVVLPEGFPHGDRLRLLRPVETLPFYRAAADVLLLGELDRLGVPRGSGRAALCAPWLCPELTAAAERLRAQVRELVIDVPGQEGGGYAQWLHAQYGLPALPAGAPADAAAAFGPCPARREPTLILYGPQARRNGLKLSAPGLDLPPDCTQPLLALLWEAGTLDRETLTASHTGSPAASGA